MDICLVTTDEVLTGLLDVRHLALCASARMWREIKLPA
jgi:hypothetical protein